MVPATQAHKPAGTHSDPTPQVLQRGGHLPALGHLPRAALHCRGRHPPTHSLPVKWCISSAWVTHPVNGPHVQTRNYSLPEALCWPPLPRDYTQRPLPQLRGREARPRAQRRSVRGSGPRQDLKAAMAALMPVAAGGGGGGGGGGSGDGGVRRGEERVTVEGRDMVGAPAP